ncbi:ElaA protein [Frondihabitans sucicola]|uniref:ElaA protein n=1 Tax=Frondihabitans sucicola TaxID=1268041 RepID=A0ABM8GTM7_9MICO|nr:GNAT family N-acetyltransferase [Frondihabitans sucicola]BDZ51805.1 ElaA protein [Frondihabitans sucicola]
MTVTHQESLTSDLDPVVLYEILRLRVDVFVVEQGCAYPELDGRDVEPTARQFWSTDDDDVAATLRLLHDGEDRRIGRVATAQAARGRGFAGVLMQRAVDECGGRAIHLDAQERLEGWYGRYGFERSGEDFVEDGLVHIPMTRAAR